MVSVADDADIKQPVGDRLHTQFSAWSLPAGARPGAPFLASVIVRLGSAR